LVTVGQKYKPRVYKITYNSYHENNKLDFFYKDHLASFWFEDDVTIENDNYHYKVLFNNIELDTGESSKDNDFRGIPLIDTGFVNATFIVYDENNISDSFDTTFYIGDHETMVSFSLPDLLSTELGGIIESHALVYDKNIWDYFYDIDKDNIVNYNGPSDGVLVNSSDQLNSFDFSFFDDHNGLTLHSFVPMVNEPFSFKVAAHSDGTQDYNELKTLVVLVGNQGIAYGEKVFNVIPGSTAQTEVVNLIFKSY
jgi:hypothetical protein